MIYLKKLQEAAAYALETEERIKRESGETIVLGIRIIPDGIVVVGVDGMQEHFTKKIVPWVQFQFANFPILHASIDEVANELTYRS